MSDEVLELLRHGDVEIEGRFSNSSNTTLLVSVRTGQDSIQAVYKPESGERPLWDFPSGLWRREVAAYELSEFFGFGFVPETVARLDGPAGPGSLQRYVEEDFTSHYFTLRDDAVHLDTLKALAAFDVVANNSDRKSGHVLYGEGQIWAIDHGLCFHEEDKLRTVIWDFGLEDLTEASTHALNRLLVEVPETLEEVLSEIEIACTVARARDLLAAGVLPEMNEDQPYPPYPWPLV